MKTPFLDEDELAELVMVPIEKRMKTAAQLALIGTGAALDGAAVEIDDHLAEVMDRLYDFGVKREFPPAETFCRQFCEWSGQPFDAARWKEDISLRAQWLVFRAAVKALSSIDIPSEPAEPAPARPRDPDDGFERQSGAFDRERIGGGKAKTRLQPVEPSAAEVARGKVPLTDVKGIGKATAAKLEAVGINTVGELASLPEEGLVDHLTGQGCAAKCSEVASAAVVKGDLIVLARKHLTAASN
jgi:predicted flap endonuclease-1-like 5' DNA nuclease